jgi:hypothetical protein
MYRCALHFIQGVIVARERGRVEVRCANGYGNKLTIHKKTDYQYDYQYYYQYDYRYKYR